MKLLVLAVSFALLACERAGVAAEKKVAPDPSRPLLAIWVEDEGRVAAGSKGPFLRIAVWKDGRVLFAKDPEKWNHELREGRLSAERIAELKKELAATGVFGMNNASYLVPDAGSVCVMLDFDGKTQILRWDENESANYGINIDPKPRRLKFKECWKAVNRVALAARPAESREFAGKFQPSRSWPLRPAIQSR